MDPLDYTGPIVQYFHAAENVPGWLRGEEARAMASTIWSLPDECVIVEIGSFLGSSSVLLAGTRKLRGSGKVHCVDPFDGSGDSYSVPVYTELHKQYAGQSLRECFDGNVQRARVKDWIEVHQGTATEVAQKWNRPVDLLFLDGDHSPNGARLAYESWYPKLKVNGIIAVHNTGPRVYDKDHDGSQLIALNEIKPPRYTDIRLVEWTTFARKIR